MGCAIARRFLAEPHTLVCMGVRAHRQSAEKLAEEFPVRCSCLELDVTDVKSWKTAVEQIMQKHGRIDVLVNNAGKHSDALLAMMSVEQWQEVVKTSLDGAFYGCQAVLPTMLAQRSGRIINVASLSALIPPAGQTNYAAAKAGLIALTRSLAKEVGRANITVNAICPGYIETGALAKLSAEERAEAVRRVPMRRFGKPEEVAAAVRFLACPEAGYITGSTLKIDGGIF